VARIAQAPTNASVNRAFHTPVSTLRRRSMTVAEAGHKTSVYRFPAASDKRARRHGDDWLVHTAQLFSRAAILTVFADFMNRV